jgi:hypothetical protein
VAEALYRRIEFSGDLADVWGRLHGDWDWLGVTAEGEFVLGYPSRPGERPRPEIRITAAGVAEGVHGVRLTTAAGTTTTRWYGSTSRASEEFAAALADLRGRRPGGPVLTLVQLLEKGEVLDEAFVVSPA